MYLFIIIIFFLNKPFWEHAALVLCLSVGISGDTAAEGGQEDQKSREKCAGANRGGTAKQGNASYLIPSVALNMSFTRTHLPVLF